MTDPISAPAGDSLLSSLRQLWPYIWPRHKPALRARIGLAALCMGLGKIGSVAAPLLFARAIDKLGIGATGASLAIGLILAYGLARLISQGLFEMRDALFARVAFNALRTVGGDVFRHLHALSLRFHLGRQTGGLNRAITRGTQAVETLLRVALFSVGPTIFELLLSCSLLWWKLGAQYAVIVFAMVAGYLYFTVRVSDWRIAFRREANDSDTRANSRAVDSLLNYETVKYFGNEDHEARRYDDSLAAYERASNKSQRSLAVLNLGQTAIIGAGQLLLLYLAGRGVVDGRMTIGDFVLVNTLVLQLYQPLFFFGFFYREIKQGLIDLETMLSLLKVEKEIQDAPGAPPLAVSGGTVEFQDVHFAYDPRRPILKGVTFAVPAGKSVAIVGPSGAGKSTLGRLLFRFFDPDSGRILIDGQDITAITQNSLRRAVGIVPQDTVLFNDTIRYNIAYARPGANDEDVAEAARMAHIGGFIASLPDKFESLVGERGLKLSGGEKQRVAIARTILKNPPILLFDEATSALDTHTEREIQANLAEIAVGRTSLVIAHRLSTVVACDEILVLDHGRIVERGSHADLLRLDALYARMWNRQQAEAAVAELPEEAAAE